MPSLAPAQQLRRLDKSSTRFPGQISKLIHGQKYTAWVNNLHEDDPVWVVEYFDDVCPSLFSVNPFLELHYNSGPPHPPTRIARILDVLA